MYIYSNPDTKRTLAWGWIFITIARSAHFVRVHRNSLGHFYKVEFYKYISCLSKKIKIEIYCYFFRFI